MKEKALEFTTYFLVGLTMLVLAPIFGKWLDARIFHTSHTLARNPILIVTGIIIFVTGALIGLWTVVLFKTRGKGTPNPLLPPKNFVRQGPYAYTRNPMVLGGFAILTGEAAIYGSITLLLIAFLFLAVLYVYIRSIEEPELLRRFGAEYEAYLLAVPRFFRIPGKRNV